MDVAQQSPNKSGAAPSGPRSQLMLQFPNVAAHVLLEDATPIADALGEVLRGWTPAHIAEPETLTRVSSVLGTGDSYAAHSSYLGETIHGLGVAGATCAIVADLAQDYFVTRPGSLALHCAAFQFNNRLIAMTGPTRAGKSTLAARMTQEADMAVFCDDVLPLLVDGDAVALGIAPRLRLPLPDTCAATFKAHVARHTGPSDTRYAYVCAPTVAPHGTKAPLSVLLILDREAEASARLHHVADDEALHFLLSQNMADLDTADAAYARTSAVLDEITCLRLVYSDLEDAVALIRDAFGCTAPVSPDIEIGPLLQKTTAVPLPQADLSPDICWSRNLDVVMQHKANSAFLWKPGTQMIWHMNTLGLAVWTLLEIPGSAREIGQLLAEQFADSDEAVLIRDVNALMLALYGHGLILRARIERPVG